MKRWNAYIMIGNIKLYLRRSMTTREAVKWLQEKCKTQNSNHFKCGTQVFCECR